ncbi:hypothetical protein B0H67DRAFT_557292 [Lasiosphaeris hirsuta]|uniref:Uncharacterized protein n=1 Tax=Lasiosphaeris hirsuta TaxID=260670 RepID=A0AA39ZVI0_9PEZI|nr:hypothetical protein B0H67DRAFT_557292 [Lasiosphaeris hirsuta]
MDSVREDVPIMPLDSKLQTQIHNFFPPLILLESIHKYYNQRTVLKAADASPNPSQGPEDNFRTFINKLAHIYNYRPKGDTVLYLFVSNSQTRADLNKTKQDLTALLNILKGSVEAKARLPN